MRYYITVHNYDNVAHDVYGYVDTYAPGNIKISSDIFYANVDAQGTTLTTTTTSKVSYDYAHGYNEKFGEGNLTHEYYFNTRTTDVF